jgi:hypothetical protein
MLSIVATLEEFWSMLLGAFIYVYTNHKNLTFDDLKTQRVLCWRNKIKEFLPWLHYIEGKKNIHADNLSRFLCLPTLSQIAEGKKLIEPAIVLKTKMRKTGFSHHAKTPLSRRRHLQRFWMLSESAQDPRSGTNPLSFSSTCKQQQQDKQLLALQVKYPEQYIYKSLDKDADDITCYVRPW